MGIVQSQSIKNTVITFIGFGIGAINALFLYTSFLDKLHYGIVATILSFANILMPIMAFGVHNSLIRFFSSYKSEKEREEFLSFMLLFPLVLIIPLSVLFCFFYEPISNVWLLENPSLAPYFWTIPLIGLFMAYFEIYYAWVKVQLQSVIGNLISEVFVRIFVTLFLFAVHFHWITKKTFVFCVVLAYFLQLVVMKIYAFRIQKPVLRFVVPKNIKEIITYSLFIIVSGGIAVMLIDFDKVMIPKYLHVSNNSLYSVAIFIATVIIVPSRAMNQIVAPLTAKLMQEKNFVALNKLYKQSAINLQVIGGLLMILIFLNIKELYKLIPKDYSQGIWVVYMIGLTKFYDVILGNNNSIIINTKYYRTVLFFGVFTVFLMIVLNMIFIPLYGINGSAFATLLTVVFYNTIKLFYVVNKLKLYPFTLKTVYSLLIIIVCFALFYFWDFSFHPILNVTLKSLFITSLYVFLHYIFNISEEFNTILRQVIRKVAVKI